LLKVWYLAAGAIGEEGGVFKVDGEGSWNTVNVWRRMGKKTTGAYRLK
jgi:hypothetical protein